MTKVTMSKVTGEGCSEAETFQKWQGRKKKQSAESTLSRAFIWAWKKLQSREASHLALACHLFLQAGGNVLQTGFTSVDSGEEKKKKRFSFYTQQMWDGGKFFCFSESAISWRKESARMQFDQKRLLMQYRWLMEKKKTTLRDTSICMLTGLPTLDLCCCHTWLLLCLRINHNVCRF